MTIPDSETGRHFMSCVHRAQCCFYYDLVEVNNPTIHCFSQKHKWFTTLHHWTNNCAHLSVLCNQFKQMFMLQNKYAKRERIRFSHHISWTYKLFMEDLRVYGLYDSLGVEVTIFNDNQTGGFPARGAPMLIWKYMSFTIILYY